MGLSRSLAVLLAIVPITVIAQPAPAPKPAPKQPPVPATPKAPPKPKGAGKLPAIETFELPNGLKVAVLANDAAPVVAVQVWYHAGSKDEPRDRRGSAHMFEHIMFKGTKHVRAEEHATLLNKLGGYVNGSRPIGCVISYSAPTCSRPSARS